jgi:hypothetical protein
MECKAMDEADLFLVRVWYQPLGFRASVRRVDKEKVRMFARCRAARPLLQLDGSEPDVR